MPVSETASSASSRLRAGSMIAQAAAATSGLREPDRILWRSLAQRAHARPARQHRPPLKPRCDHRGRSSRHMRFEVARCARRRSQIVRRNGNARPKIATTRIVPLIGRVKNTVQSLLKLSMVVMKAFRPADRESAEHHGCDRKLKRSNRKPTNPKTQSHTDRTNCCGSERSNEAEHHHERRHQRFRGSPAPCPAARSRSSRADTCIKPTKSEAKTV